MASTSEWELPLGLDRHQIPLFYSSLFEGTSLAASAVSNPHNATRHLLEGHIISASNSAPVSPLPRPFASGLHHARHSLRAIGAARAERPKRHQPPQTVLDSLPVPDARICASREVPRAGHGSTHARNDPLLSHRGCVEEDIALLSQDILRDADSLLSVAPRVFGESELYNRDWTEWDMKRFIRILMEESEITCQWGDCGDRMKIKEIKTHLERIHDIRSHPKPYDCLWNGCSSGKRMTELSSLIRHLREHHGSVYKYWPCLGCERSFTREETLLNHLGKCAGRRRPQAAPQGLMVSSQRFA